MTIKLIGGKARIQGPVFRSENQCFLYDALLPQRTAPSSLIFTKLRLKIDAWLYSQWPKNLVLNKLPLPLKDSSKIKLSTISLSIEKILAVAAGTEKRENMLAVHHKYRKMSASPRWNEKKKSWLCKNRFSPDSYTSYQMLTPSPFICWARHTYELSVKASVQVPSVTCIGWGVSEF